MSKSKSKLTGTQSSITVIQTDHIMTDAMPHAFYGLDLTFEGYWEGFPSFLKKWNSFFFETLKRCTGMVPPDKVWSEHIPIV